MESVLAFFADPIVKSIALVVLGWALKMGRDAAVIYLRQRRSANLLNAQRELDCAAATPGTDDDAVAEERAAGWRARAEILEAFAQALEKQSPQALLEAAKHAKDGDHTKALAVALERKP